ncbi:hypothetical protein SAY87_030588 [Trapa incisa]|uniref:Uncharacterized protein n=1 Tax=Trapa incisa TaxID=236973 RepID=A0AAN7QKC0_9MYRT|nr:hypothetical protein SAY87_030588 [Trapa incisa]
MYTHALPLVISYLFWFWKSCPFNIQYLEITSAFSCQGQSRMVQRYDTEWMYYQSPIYLTMDWNGIMGKSLYRLIQNGCIIKGIRHLFSIGSLSHNQSIQSIENSRENIV